MKKVLFVASILVLIPLLGDTPGWTQPKGQPKKVAESVLVAKYQKHLKAIQSYSFPPAHHQRAGKIAESLNILEKLCKDKGAGADAELKIELTKHVRELHLDRDAIGEGNLVIRWNGNTWVTRDKKFDKK